MQYIACLMLEKNRTEHVPPYLFPYLLNFSSAMTMNVVSAAYEIHDGMAKEYRFRGSESCPLDRLCPSSVPRRNISTLSPRTLRNVSCANQTMPALSGTSSFIAPQPHTSLLSGQPHLIKTIESFYVRPRWLFIRVETETGVVGWGEGTLEGHTDAIEGSLMDIGRR